MKPQRPAAHFPCRLLRSMVNARSLRRLFSRGSVYQTSTRAVIADNEQAFTMATFLFVVLLPTHSGGNNNTLSRQLPSTKLCAFSWPTLLLPHGLPPGRPIGFPAGLHQSTTTSSPRNSVRATHGPYPATEGTVPCRCRERRWAFLWTQLFFTKRLTFPTCLSSLR
jgi:hypothetical protein